MPSEAFQIVIQDYLTDWLCVCATILIEVVNSLHLYDIM